METLAALMGDSTLYTAAERDADNGWRLYYYEELECKVCHKPCGLYMRQMLVGIAGSTFYACASCKARNPGKFDDLMGGAEAKK